ncbi:DUF58 domain-containing protein [uncultured Tessaracoccus sp.]|uniref:DUF58 domain-containing protein n=1 Tax=uncultured Tessaracoccus sp. TaxID=905023 RepID=UPI0025F8CD5A|nr:DUF58 domain-containing protein [uncultured Tessaracoccus sp.]
MSTSTRWEIPEAVDPPSGETLRWWYRALSKRVGMRDAGWVCLLIGVVALVVGLVLRWQEFVLVGVVAVVAVGVALLFTIGRPRLEVRLQVSDRAVVVGERAQGRVLVRAQPGTRHLGSRLDLPVGEERASFWLPMLRSAEMREFRFRVPTERRGLVVVGPALSVQGDPFGLAGRETRWTGEEEVHVHPRTVRLPGRQTGFVHDLEGHASPNLSSSDMNFHALRPYVAGDDRRHVHWKSTARTGQLMVRQFEESRMSTVLLALDTGRASYIDEDEFELAVSVVASLAQQCILGESELSIVTSREELAAASLTLALDELSLVEATPRGGVADLAHTCSRLEHRSSIAMLVTGSTASLDDLRLASSRFDVDTRYIGIRVASGAELRHRQVGNVTLNQVGSLADLPRAMRRSMT